MNNSSTKKTLSVIASVLIGLSAVLPYLKASVFGATASASLIDGADGYILIGIAIIALICSLTEKYIPNIICGVAALGLFFLENNNVARSMTGLDSSSRAIANSMLQNGIGYYFLLIGSVGLIVISILALNEKKKEG